MADGEGVFEYEADTSTLATQIVILDSSGKPVRIAQGETGAGSHTFTWDGKDNDGNALEDGIYTVQIQGKDRDGKTVEFETRAVGRVTGVEVRDGLLDLAVNVYDGPRPAWLDRALVASLADATSYPDPAPAAAAITERHGRQLDEVLPTAGAAEAFTLIARQPWRRPVVVHPQFTEPHAALELAGHHVTTVSCRPEDGFAIDPAAVPDEADLVMVGNPTNPTGVLHPAEVLERLRRPGRVVVVDEAFMDAVPGETETLLGGPVDGVVVLRSLTKHWSIPGIRAGYMVGDAGVVRRLAAQQTPWSVSTTAIAATVACCTPTATGEAEERAHTLAGWREVLVDGFRARGIEQVPSAAPFVLARLGAGTRAALREEGVAVRRADTFPGLDGSWARIAVRPPATTVHLFAALDRVRAPEPAL